MKKINKKNIRRNIAAIAALAILASAGTGIIVEKSVDHTENICPLCTILGMEHQANSINGNSKKYNGATAEYLNDYSDTVYLKHNLTYPSGTIVIDGKGYIDGKLVNAVAPMVSGYTFISIHDNYALYKQTTHYDECVKITYLDGATKILARDRK